MPERYEYIRLPFDIGDLSELNRFGGDGWRVCSVFQQAGGEAGDIHIALLERKIPNERAF